MGNQAQQSQELELWEVVSRSGNKRRRTRPARTVRQSAQSSYDQQKRGNSKTNTPQNADSIQMINPNVPKANRKQTARSSTQAPKPNIQSRAQMTRQEMAKARLVRAEYVPPVRQRTSTQKTRANTQSSKKKKVGRRARISQIFAIMWVMAMSAAIVFMGKIFYQSMQKIPEMYENKTVETILENIPVVEEETQKDQKPEIREDFLTISEYNRPGTELAVVKNIFVHYTANPGTSAAQNRSYFENLGQTHERAASAHFIIGYEGEIVQCIPLEEEAYAVIERNKDSISIECCYLKEDGSFTQETYNSLIKMLVWLTDKYHLEPEDILRHYDCGGKKCPIYYVEHEDAWQRLLDDVRAYKDNSITE